MDKNSIEKWNIRERFIKISFSWFQTQQLLLAVQCSRHLLPCAVGIRQTECQLHGRFQEEDSQTHPDQSCQVSQIGSLKMKYKHTLGKMHISPWKTFYSLIKDVHIRKLEILLDFSKLDPHTYPYESSIRDYRYTRIHADRHKLLWPSKREMINIGEMPVLDYWSRWIEYVRHEFNSKSPTSQTLKFSYFQVYVLQEFLLMIFIISFYHSNPSNSFTHLQRLGWSPSVHSDSAASSRHPFRGDQSIRGWSRSDDDSDGCRPARTRRLC